MTAFEYFPDHPSAKAHMVATGADQGHGWLRYTTTGEGYSVGHCPVPATRPLRTIAQRTSSVRLCHLMQEC